MKLIDKDALVAEIERRKYQFVSQAEAFHKIGKEDKESYFAALASNMNSLSCFLDTLEVKEEVTTTDAFIEKAKEAFCKATCNGHPPRSTCTSLGTCKEHDNFVKIIMAK